MRRFAVGLAALLAFARVGKRPGRSTAGARLSRRWRQERAAVDTGTYVVPSELTPSLDGGVSASKPALAIPPPQASLASQPLAGLVTALLAQGWGDPLGLSC